MLKAHEVSDPASCLNKARDDEPIFVLRANDPAAPFTIAAWITLRELLALNRHNDPKLTEALGYAAAMIRWLKGQTDAAETLAGPQHRPQ